MQKCATYPGQQGQDDKIVEAPLSRLHQGGTEPAVWLTVIRLQRARQLRACNDRGQQHRRDQRLPVAQPPARNLDRPSGYQKLAFNQMKRGRAWPSTHHLVVPMLSRRAVRHTAATPAAATHSPRCWVEVLLAPKTRIVAQNEHRST